MPPPGDHPALSQGPWQGACGAVLWLPGPLGLLVWDAIVPVRSQHPGPFPRGRGAMHSESGDRGPQKGWGTPPLREPTPAWRPMLHPELSDLILATGTRDSHQRVLPGSPRPRCGYRPAWREESARCWWGEGPVGPEAGREVWPQAHAVPGLCHTLGFTLPFLCHSGNSG